ncbi:MAG: DUF2339 domain-containing protein, partial [Enhydrobacter sp.]|nr:DUF2339 domain-containing protein [Enhydrobacter sp.]
MDEVLMILFGIAWAVGTPIVALVALVRSGNVRAENRRLAAEIAELRRQIGQGGSGGSIRQEAAEEAAAVPELPPPVPESSGPPAAELPPPFEPAAPPPPVPAFELPPSPSRAGPFAPGWEQRLGSRAFIWIGAVTLALAAVFLVRHSIEEGYLSPEVRVILAALFGFALIGGAERMRPRDERVAQALAAAGVAALYGALFAAVALYGMISQAAAGGGAMALTAFAIGVSLRHGILVAALAFVGGFASPVIIGSETPNTPVLFGYLLAVAAGTLAVIRHRGWWPLGWGVLAGSALWIVAWLDADAGGLPWACAFLVAVAGLFVWATWRRVAESENLPIDVTALVWTALAGTGVLLAAAIFQDKGEQNAGWLALAVHGLGLYALARWTPRFQYVASLAPALSLATLGLWWFDDQAIGLVDPFDTGRFAWLAIAYGGLYAAGAFALMWNAGRPGFWAALSVSAALAHFLLCWWVMRDV